ncbi:MAG: argininosuccinate lyase, partial [Gemmatimonadales bacterium]
MAPDMVPLNRSLSVDYRLWRHDIRGSRAWTRALGRADVLSAEEVQILVSGLDGVEERLDGTDVRDHPDEDIHSLVERLLGEEVGPVAGKLHTGRSRNDQVATDMRLWGMEACRGADHLLSRHLDSLMGLARSGTDLMMPGYTHLQQGQPVRAGHWVLSHAWPILRDRARFRSVGRSAAVLPLGSGALAGCPFPVDREFLREELGFEAISENSMDGTSDRDWMVEYLAAAALLGVHLSRLGEDLLLFSSREFGTVRLPDGYSTGSSLMPQKRNPDVAELVRGKAARLVGGLQGLLVLLKGLPTGYNRDLQEDKTFVFDAADTLALVLPPLAGALEGTRFVPEAIERIRNPELLATDLADILVRGGIPFRQAHDIVGAVVREAEESGVSLADLSDEAFGRHHPVLADGAARAAFDWEASVEAPGLPRGAGPAP